MGSRLIWRAAGALLSVVFTFIGVASATAAMAAESVAAQESAAADLTLLKRILAQIGAYPVVHADFLQTRTSALLSAPALTRGSLVFVRERGVVWQVRSPQAQGYVYGRQRSARLDADGNVLSLDTQPSGVTQQINEWANAFMHGDTSGLASQFSVAVTGTVNRWQIVLTPSQPQIAQVMRRLTLNGDTVVRGVTLETRRGESVRWQFEKVRTGEALDSNEQRLLRTVE
ncbi:outer membrane lipoprotein carrier protein LolA [Pandoraea sp. PE-S2R-1]|uniref:LolA family protein n=1 Tax=Pandoraea sp. PE-S2R-1 TaxID=1986994 RepID=UPI000B3FF2AC|nr:outer membrane lipoprotein carrier protein LolA [Pandoraea sp. PE-S2R-1]